MRNLQKTNPGNQFETVGETLASDSLDDFTEAAKRWLEDRSELRTKTIESADYRTAFEYFRR